MRNDTCFFVASGSYFVISITIIFLPYSSFRGQSYRNSLLLGDMVDDICSIQEETTMQIVVRFKGKDLTLQCPLNWSLRDIKLQLVDSTGLALNRQKLIGFLHNGRPALDEHTLAEVKFKKKIMLLGTSEKDVFIDPQNVSKEELPAVFCDFDYDYSIDTNEWQFKVKNQETLQLYKDVKLNLIHPPRQGKKLLVLDLDHTLFDFTSDATDMESLKRPGMDFFLESISSKYDIAIWSQTSWRWLEIKLTELGMLTNQAYHICFVLDKSSMFLFNATSKKGVRRHQVKALDIIWSKFPEYWNPSNTVHVDDLSRNFAMNPNSGIKIKPFYRNDENAKHDRELVDLLLYLVYVCGDSMDLRSFRHSKWRTAIQPLLDNPPFPTNLPFHRTTGR